MLGTVQVGLTPDAKYITITFGYDANIVELVKMVPSARWNPNEKCWRITNSVHHLAELLTKLTLRDPKIVLMPELRDDLKKVGKHLKDKEKQSLLIQEIRSATDYPDEDFPYLRNITLYPYQKVGIKFIEATNGRCILADEMGLGKTVQAMSFPVSRNLKTLIICTATLNLKWKREIEKYTIKTARVLKTTDRITKEDIEKYDFHIVNYDKLIKRTYKRKGATITQENVMVDDLTAMAKANGFDCVILDEAHKAKNKKTGWTKFILKYLIKIEHRIVVTGTPIVSRPIEYFTLLKFVDRFTWADEQRYALRYCNAFHNGFGMDSKGASNIPELYQNTFNIMIRRLKKDHLKDLPDKIYTVVPIELTSKQFLDYRSRETNFSVTNAHDVKKFTSEIKENAAIDIIESIIEAGQKIIVFTEYLFVVEMIKKAFEKNCVVLTGKNNAKQRANAEAEFQTNPKVQVFVGTYDAAGVGIDLTAAETVLFIDQPWTPGEFGQASDRAHRIGQKKSVEIITLLCDGTIDAYIYDLLEEKSRIISQAIDNTDYEVSKGLSIMQELLAMIKRKNEE